MDAVGRYCDWEVVAVSADRRVAMNMRAMMLLEDTREAVTCMYYDVRYVC